MKNQFDWQTGEHDQQETKEYHDSFHSFRRKPSCLTFTFLVVLVVISALVWLVNNTQSEAVASVNEDVLLTFELQQQAIEENDEELFSAILSSNDPSWKRDQEELFAANLIDDRKALGLFGVSTPINRRTLVFSPDLQKAELSFVRDYTVLSSEETSEVELLQHQFFHLENGRWMRSPADHSFWGPWSKVDGKYVEITYPERDVKFVQALVEVVDSYLENLCYKVEGENYFGEYFCEGNLPWQIRVRTDDRALLDFAQSAAVKSSKFDYELPSPSLVGAPLTSKDLDVYLDLYTEFLFPTMGNVILTTVTRPEQFVYALCFKHSSGPRKLFRYDWRFRSWQPELPVQTFNYLSALPDDSMIMVAEGETITTIGEDTNSSLSEKIITRHLKIPMLNSQTLLGWVKRSKSPYFLLMSLSSRVESPRYAALDLQICEQGICYPEKLPGFPIPSPMSDATLYINGSDIFLSTGSEKIEKLVGKGFSPFWIDGETFGFVRFHGDMATNIMTQVVIQHLSNGQLQVLVDGHALASEEKTPWAEDLFIHEVIPKPMDSNKLLITGTGVRDYSGYYFIFSLDISDLQNVNAFPKLQLEISRRGSLVGVPGLLAPTGFPMILVSPNGRWLAMAELNSQDTWTILIHDLLKGRTVEVIKDIPAVPGNLPMLDWSADGQWLLIADREFLHLIAPEYEYQDRIAHDFDACSHIVWAG
jgi:hypothetical protein